MALYLIKLGSVKQGGRLVHAGEVVELDPAEAKKMDPAGVCFEAVVVGALPPSTPHLSPAFVPPEQPTGEPDPEPMTTDLSAKDAIEMVEACTDPAALDRWAASGEERTTVLKAIEKRMAELSAPPS